MARKKSSISIAVSPQNADNFSAINGIGLALSKRIHDAGILTYRQLASLTPAELAARVIGLSAKQIALQDWTGQARKLISNKSQTKTSKKAAPKKAIRQHYENFTLEFLIDEKHAVRRTRVAHFQSGDADTWAGWQAESLLDFLARHTGVQVPVVRPKEHTYSTNLNRNFQDRIRKPQTTEPEITAPTPPHSAAARGAVPITETILPSIEFPITPPLQGRLCLRKLEVLIPYSNHPVTFIRQEQPYLIRLTLDLTEVDTPSDTPLIYKASIVSQQLGGTRHSIGEHLSTLNFSKSINLDIKGIDLQPGTYRLEAFAEIRYDEATPGLTANMKGGLLQVY